MLFRSRSPPVRHHPFVMAPLEVEIGLVQEDLRLDLVYQIPTVGALVDQRVDEVRGPLAISHVVNPGAQVHLGQKRREKCENRRDCSMLWQSSKPCFLLSHNHVND